MPIYTRLNNSNVEIRSIVSGGHNIMSAYTVIGGVRKRVFPNGSSLKFTGEMCFDNANYTDPWGASGTFATVKGGTLSSQSDLLSDFSVYSSWGNGNPTTLKCSNYTDGTVNVVWSGLIKKLRSDYNTIRLYGYFVEVQPSNVNPQMSYYNSIDADLSSVSIGTYIPVYITYSGQVTCSNLTNGMYLAFPIGIVDGASNGWEYFVVKDPSVYVSFSV